VPVAVATFSLALVTLLLLWLGIDRPLKRLEHEIQSLSRGEGKRVDDDQYGGRLGSIARSLNTALIRRASTTPPSTTDAMLSVIGMKTGERAVVSTRSNLPAVDLPPPDQAPVEEPSPLAIANSEIGTETDPALEALLTPAGKSLMNDTSQEAAIVEPVPIHDTSKTVSPAMLSLDQSFEQDAEATAIAAPSAPFAQSLVDGSILPNPEEEIEREFRSLFEQSTGTHDTFLSSGSPRVLRVCAYRTCFRVRVGNMKSALRSPDEHQDFLTPACGRPRANERAGRRSGRVRRS